VSLELVTIRPGVDNEEEGIVKLSVEIKRIAVIWSLWPRNLVKRHEEYVGTHLKPLLAHRYNPASETMSQTIRSVSCEPDASLVPAESNVRAVTAFLCPFSVVTTEPDEALQRRMDPSAYPTAKVSLRGER
jgi:hypothetical protein